MYWYLLYEGRTMNFNGHLNTQISSDERVMSELLGNAFRSVQQQMRLSPLRNYSYSSANNARFRLNLYAMNTGFLEYFLTSKLKANSKLYIYDLRKHLIEIICHADPEVVENLEQLILDKELISKLVVNTISDDEYKILSKKELLKGYLLNRIKEYHYSVGLKLKLMSSSDSNKIKPNLIAYPITKVFTEDVFGADHKNSYEFQTKFSYNICMKCLNLFSEEVEEIFGL